MMQIFSFVGRVVIRVANAWGLYFLFVMQAVRTFFTCRLKIHKTFVQMERIGVLSFPIAVLTGTFAGAVLALQSYYGFQSVGIENMIGSVVALSLTRELGPVLTGLMVAGRSGSGIAAEIGTMRITEQLDALQTLNIDNHQYLIIPRILAASIIMPFLTMFAMFFGVIGGYVVYVYYFHLNPVDYVDSIKDFLEPFDIIGGLIKSSVFGFILSSVGAYCGFYTRGGAKGVGISTTQSVVISSIAILISNYFLAMVLFETG